MKGEQVNHLQMYEAVPFTVPHKIILFNTEQCNPQKHRSIRKYQELIVTYITLEEMWDLSRWLPKLWLMYACILWRPFSEILHITLLIHIPWPTFYLTRVKLLQLHSYQLHKVHWQTAAIFWSCFVFTPYYLLIFPPFRDLFTGVTAELRSYKHHNICNPILPMINPKSVGNFCVSARLPGYL